MEISPCYLIILFLAPACSRVPHRSLIFSSVHLSVGVNIQGLMAIIWAILDIIMRYFEVYSV